MKYGLSNTEAINAIRKNYPPENYSVLREALDMAIEALERTRWIPVSERLQDDLKECLLYLKLENGNQMAVGYFDIFIKKYFAMVHPYEALKEEIVTHWMPLPEPPEMVPDDRGHWDGIAPEQEVDNEES